MWEAFARDGNAAPVLAFLRAHPQTGVPCGHGYPALHRVRDVMLGDTPYRLSRCSICDEELSLAAIDPPTAARLDDAGVPYWLTGERLRDWVEDERRQPSKGPIDWEQWG